MSNSEKIAFIPVVGITKEEGDDLLEMSREGIVVLSTVDCTTKEPVKIMLASNFSDLRNFMEAIGYLADQVKNVIENDMPENVVKH